MFHSMRSKMILMMLAVTASLTVVITMIFYGRSADQIEENYVENLYARIRQMGEALDESLGEIYFLTVQASCDEDILAKTKDYLASGEEERLAEIAQLLRMYSKRNVDVGSIYLMLPQEKIAETTLTPQLIEDPLRESGHLLVFSSPVEDSDGRICAYIMSNLTERSLYYNYLDGLEDGKTSKAMLLDGTGRIVSAKELFEVGQNHEAKQENGEKPENEQEMISVQYQMDFFGYSFWMEREKSEVLFDLKEIQAFMAVILAAVFGIGAVLIILITRAMYQPLKNLTETMELVSGGELFRRVEVTAKDEIGTLSKNFNDMLAHIESLIGRLVQEEMLKKNAELEALQYQITPHFMYNTLNSIKYAALLRGEEEIGGLIEDFTELLQASINKKGRFVTVADEVHFAQNYMNLQRMRYEEEIVVDYQVQEEAFACFVPRLVLQPLVENAILHGLDLKAGKNRIVIGGKVEEGRLCLWVEDNGRGMSEAQIEQLLQENHKKEKGLSGIGVSNVKERMQLYYGEAGKVTCVSSEAGTKVCMCLPAYKEQDRYAL
jgi:two-component system sensor histidine kinase YesM